MRLFLTLLGILFLTAAFMFGLKKGNQAASDAWTEAALKAGVAEKTKDGLRWIKPGELEYVPVDDDEQPDVTPLDLWMMYAKNHCLKCEECMKGKRDDRWGGMCKEAWDKFNGFMILAWAMGCTEGEEWHKKHSETCPHCKVDHDCDHKKCDWCEDVNQYFVWKYTMPLLLYDFRAEKPK